MHRFSIIIPVKPGGDVKALANLKWIDYPSDLFEVLVAEGCRPSRQRNSAASEAGGDILYFLDDDSLVSPDFLKRADSYFADPSVAVAGGPSLTPEADSRRQRAFGLAFASIFGGGGARNRYRRTGSVRETDDSELILCNLSFRRGLFLEMGGFDERLYPNEENELMSRIKEKGLKLIHDPELAVHRSQRKSMKAFIRQLFGYGRGRAEQTIIAGFPGIVSFAPLFFVLYLLLLPFFNNQLYYLPLLCYLILTVISGVAGAARGKDPALAPLLWAVFPLLHISYGTGNIWGFTFGRLVKKTSDSGVTVKKVKPFGGGWDPDLMGESSPGGYKTVS